MLLGLEQKYTPKNLPAMMCEVLHPKRLRSCTENGGSKCARELTLYFNNTHTHIYKTPSYDVTVLTSSGTVTGSLVIARNRSMGFELKRGGMKMELIAPEAC